MIQKHPISFQKTLLQVGKNRNMFPPLNTHGCHEKLSFTSPHRLRPSHKGAESTLKAVQVRHILSPNAKCNNRLLGIWYFHDTMIQWFNCQKLHPVHDPSLQKQNCFWYMWHIFLRPKRLHFEVSPREPVAWPGKSAAWPRTGAMSHNDP